MKLTARYQDALAFAFLHHHHQDPRDDQTPQLAHLLTVSSLVMEHGGTETEAIAALLHHTLDGEGDHLRSEIEQRFGPEVLQIVLACSEGAQPEKHNGRHPLEPWLARKTFHVQYLPHRPHPARLVGLADQVHAARLVLQQYTLLDEAIWKRFKTGKWGTLWYHRVLREGYQPDTNAPEGYCSLYRLLEDVTYTLEHLTGVEHLLTEDLRARVLVRE